MRQQWLQIIGVLFDGLGFSLISLEWYRGYLEMNNKVTLVARNLERAEQIRLKNELKAALGSVGVAEVGPLYDDDQALAEMANHVFEMNQADLFRKKRALLFFAGGRGLPVWHGSPTCWSMARMLRRFRNSPAVLGIGPCRSRERHLCGSE